MSLENVENNVREATKLLKALSNEKRLMIMCTLKRGEQSVGVLEDIVGLSQSALSQHLARLRRDGIVQTRRDAQTIYYSIKDDATKEVLFLLEKIFKGSCDP